MTDGAILWSVLILAGMLAFRYWGNNPPRPSLNWETSQEEAEEAARYAAWCNRRNRSHLSLVSGGQHGNTDYEAFKKGA